MEDAVTRPTLDATFGRGRYQGGTWLRGHNAHGIYAGHDTVDDLEVLITIRVHTWAPALVEAIQFAVPGVAPLLFFGAPDGQRDTRNLRVQRRAIIERRPAGAPLSDRTVTLSPADLVRLGLGVLDVLDAAAERRIDIQGIRPETVYLVDGPDGVRVSGVAPRAVRALGYRDDPPFRIFDGHSYEAPELYRTAEPSPTSDLFSAALVIWFAHTRAHAYPVRPGEVDGEIMVHEACGTFSGPPEIGMLLTSILVADPAARPTLAQVRTQLLELAQRWHVAIPLPPTPHVQ